MKSLASILTKPLSNSNADRLSSQARLQEVCAATRAALENYSGSGVGAAGVRLFTDAGVGLDVEVAADLFLAVATVDLLGTVFDGQFKGRAETAAAGEAEQHLIFRGVSVLGEFEGLRSLVAELLADLHVGGTVGAVTRMRLAAASRAAAEIYELAMAYVAALSARTTVLAEFERALSRSLGELGVVLASGKGKGTFKAEKMTEGLGVV